MKSFTSHIAEYLSREIKGRRLKIMLGDSEMSIETVNTSINKIELIGYSFMECYLVIFFFPCKDFDFFFFVFLTWYSGTIL